MPAIEGIIDVLGSLGSDRIAVHEGRCVLVRNRNADCLKCAEACTSGAISYADDRLVVDASRCIGCGSCATACPTCALEARSPDDGALVNAAKRSIVATKGHPVFACEMALERLEQESRRSLSRAESVLRRGKVPYDGEKVCSVPCLGRVDEALLVGMAAYGSSSTTLVCGPCSSCERAPGGRLAREVLESSRDILRAFGSPMELRMLDSVPEHVLGWSERAALDGRERRALMENVGRESARVAGAAALEAIGIARDDRAPTARSYAKVDESGVLPQFLPERRTRTFNYLRHIGAPVEEVVRSRVIGAVSIDGDACSSCRMCAVFCPTGALTKEDEHFFGVKHRPTKCVQCRLCESICPKEAISVCAEVPAGQFAGRKAVAFAMKKPSWQPNRPDSMFKKIHSVIGEDLQMCSF